MPPEAKYQVLLGVYVGAWGIVPGLTPKLIALDLSWFGLGVLSFSFGAFMHAITFPCTDAVAEVWGSARARRLIYLGVATYLIAVSFFLLGVNLPPAPGWPHNQAYLDVFGQAWRMIAASITATVVAQFADVWLFERIKAATGRRWLWLRNNGSTAVSQLLDTAIFYSIAFYGVIDTALLPTLIFGTYLVKLLLTLIDTPVVYLVVRWLTGDWNSGGDLRDDETPGPEGSTVGRA
ncbi:MAG: queuosine precursor transporter [Pseudomonadota bacterium]